MAVTILDNIYSSSSRSVVCSGFSLLISSVIFSSLIFIINFCKQNYKVHLLMIRSYSPKINVENHYIYSAVFCLLKFVSCIIIRNAFHVPIFFLTYLILNSSTFQCRLVIGLLQDISPIFLILRFIPCIFGNYPLFSLHFYFFSILLVDILFSFFPLCLT